MIQLSVILPTHNPHQGRLARTLAGLRSQTLAGDTWELIVVDNASSPAIDANTLSECDLPHVRIIQEPRLGLTYARRRGFTEAHAPLCILVDDDNVLAPDYLEQVVSIFRTHTRLGAAGGSSMPEFASAPPRWAQEFLPLLALRNGGREVRIAESPRGSDSPRNEYPSFAPIGAGMALRREAWMTWLASAEADPSITDRRGNSLTSGGDNDIVLTLFGRGWHVGYFPQLVLTHLIPTSRLEPGYLARLNRGIQKSWVQVLARHNACPWPAISAATVPARKLKAWFAYRGWSYPVGYIRWQGACGHFEGRVTIR